MDKTFLNIRSCGDFSFLSQLSREIFSGDVLNERVPFATFSLIFSSFSGDSDSDSSGQVSDSLVPNELVEFRVNSHISSLHHFGNKLLNFVNSTRCFLLELNSMSKFMDIDCGVDGGLAQPFSFLFFTHLPHK